MTNTALKPSRYLELIDSDTQRLLHVAERGLATPVPSCPGWTVADLVTHIGDVYQHKVRVMTDRAWPKPWPPAFDTTDPLTFLRDSVADLFEEFSRRDPAEPTLTFSPNDSTVLFWIRRMAHEVSVHRYDGELAHGDPTPIPDDEAIDGIDELLYLMLEVDESEEVSTDHPVDALVVVESAGHRWLCDVRARSVAVSDSDTAAAAVTISGSALPVFLWLWGRADDDLVTLAGDAGALGEFRSRLVECTQ